MLSLINPGEGRDWGGAGLSPTPPIPRRHANENCSSSRELFFYFFHAAFGMGNVHRRGDVAGDIQNRTGHIE